MKFIQNQYQLSPSYASIVGGTQFTPVTEINDVIQLIPDYYLVCIMSSFNF